MGNALILKNAPRERIKKHLLSWPGSILDWSNEDLNDFASCFKSYHVAAGKEISTKDPVSFFIVATGSVEIQAIVPTICKKTRNIREFLCKKDKGDMVFIPSMRKLIRVSNAKEFLDKENKRHSAHRDHKNVLDLIDTLCIKSINASTILQLDWKKFDDYFINIERPRSSRIDVNVLRTMMETNLTDYLEKLPILENIPYSKLETLVRMCHYNIEKEGKVICREGDLGKEVYVILSGEVKVEAMASQRTAELLSDKDSAVSSPPAKGGNNCPYSASSQEQLTQRRRTLLEARNITTRELAKNRLSRSPTSDNEKSSPPLAFEDENSDSIFVELARLGQGDYFGEMATFIDLPRAATVTVTSKSVLMTSLSKTDFRTLYHAISPDLAPSIERMVKNHMLQNIFQLKSPFLEQIGSDQIDKMAEQATIEKLREGHVVFNQGENADKFYFVYSGSLKVQKSKKGGNMYEVGRLYSGDYFGELAVINNSKRLARITTLTSAIVLEIPRQSFYECFHDTPKIIAEFIIRMKGKHVDLKSILQHNESKALFKVHLEKEHGGENLIFYDAITKFEESYESYNCKEVADQVSNIMETFLDNEAQHAVNRSHRTYTAVQEQVEAKKYSKNMFAQAQTEILQLMESDVFQRFKNTSVFSTLMVQLRSYDDLDVQLLA